MGEAVKPPTGNQYHQHLQARDAGRRLGDAAAEWMPDLRTPEFWERYRPAKDSGFTSNVHPGQHPRPGEIWLEAWHEFFNVWRILPGEKARRVYSAKTAMIGDVWPLEGGAPFGTMTFEYARCIQPYGETEPAPPESLGYRLASDATAPVSAPAGATLCVDRACKQVLVHPLGAPGCRGAVAPK